MSFIFALVKPLAYISLPVFLVRQVAVGNSPARFYARIAVYFGTLLTAASCGIFLAAGLSLVGRSADVNHYVARLFSLLVTKSLDLTVEVEGQENMHTRPAIFMTNHQSMVDVFIIGKLMPKHTAIMAKKSLQFTPLGPFMSMSGAIFIDRGNNARAIRSIEAAGERMKSTGTSLWIYPEGTRRMSQTPDMLSFKKGGFHLAINAGLPIVPIVTANYWNIYRKGVFESGVIKVRVLPAVSTASLTTADVGSLATSLRELMLTSLREISPPVETSTTASVVPTSEEKNISSSQPTTPEAKAESVGPLEALAPSINAMPDYPSESLATKGSSSSLASSATGESKRRRAAASEAGTETEEDEGMVLVGRPTPTP